MSREFESVGTMVDTIPVDISFKIIELFSANLYSSPNKAVEELVSNSYDAMASRVDLLLPANLDASDASIWVVDDGEGMDIEGLRDLWRIAYSSKRQKESADRPPIGKFGIGKLATYVLARQLTHLTHVDGQTHAVTMDFGRVKEDTFATQEIKLDLRSLSEDEVAGALADLAKNEGGKEVYDRLLSGGSGSWTAVAMSDLRPAATEIQVGRLRWILSTALPCSPQFTLFMNGRAIESSKAKVEQIEAWTIGKDDKVVEKLDSVQAIDDADNPGVLVDGISGPISGKMELFADLLTTGKSSELGRSHGFFVTVRGRLIYLDDPLFGMKALSHGPFARFRMEVQADGLDAFLTSAREGLKETPAVERFRAYLLAKFNEARARYDEHLSAEARSEPLTRKIGETARSLSRRPLFNAISQVLDGNIENLLLTSVPKGLSKEDRDTLVAELRADLDADPGLIRSVEFHAIGVDHMLAFFDVASRSIRVNILHPLFANYADRHQSHESFEVFAVAEVLTEAFMVDSGVKLDIVARLMTRRDQFFRELVAGKRRGPAAVAQHLVDCAAHSSGLEEAVVEAFRSLGFQATEIGGKGKPDGLAAATLGVRGDGAEKEDYSVTLDAKSSGKERVKAKTVGASTLARHRVDYKADYSVVVAPGFEGGDSRESALGKECVANDITPIAVADLALLVQVAPLRQINLRRLRELWTSARTPAESCEWITERAKEAPKKPPIRPFLETVQRRMSESPDPPTFSAIATALQIEEKITMRAQEVRGLAQAIGIMAPGYLTIQGEFVFLEATVDQVLGEIEQQRQELPETLVKGYMETGASSDEGPAPAG